MLMGRQMDTRADLITPILKAMMVIYLPVKFEFDWTKHFRVGVRKWKC